MNIIPFSQELANQYYQSTEQFPVSFDDAWQWLEYSRKDNAKVNFLKCGFLEGVDYVFLKIQENSEGRPTETFSLTCECFKQWGMMAGTAKGKEIRMYFLECERIAKQSMSPQQKTLPTAFEKATTVNNLAASLQLFDIQIDNPRFKQELQDLVGDILGLNGCDRKLPAQKEVWLGVAERAEQLGYAIAAVTKYRSQLGKYVKACGLECKSENRLCNGAHRPINLYRICPELDIAINEFLDAKLIGGSVN
jgi:phage anti-repressor protein